MDLISALEGLVPELEAGLAQAADLDALKPCAWTFWGGKAALPRS